MYKFKYTLSGGYKFEWVGDSKFGTMGNFRRIQVPTNEVVDKNEHKNLFDKVN